MKLSKFKLSVAAAAVTVLFGGNAFAQLTNNVGGPTTIGSNPPPGTQFSVGFEQGTPVTTGTTTAQLPAPVVMMGAGTLNQAGNQVVAPVAAGNGLAGNVVVRRYLRTADNVSTASSKGAATSGTTIAGSGDVSLIAGSAPTSTSVTEFGLFVFQDVNSNGSVAQDGSFYAQFDRTANTVLLNTAQNAPVSSIPQEYVSGTGAYSTQTATLGPVVTTAASPVGGNLFVGGNAQVVGTTTLGTTTIGALTATGVSTLAAVSATTIAATGSVTGVGVSAGTGTLSGAALSVTGSITGGTISVTNAATVGSLSTTGAITSGSITSGAITSTGPVRVGFAAGSASNAIVTPGAPGSVAVMTPDASTLVTTGAQAVAPIAAGTTRVYTRTATFNSTSTQTAGSTSGTTIAANGDVTLSAGNSGSTVTTTPFATFVFQDVSNATGAVVQDGSVYGQSSGNTILLSTLRNASPSTPGATPQNFATGTGVYAGNAPTLSATTSTTAATNSGGNLVVGGNASVTGTTLLASTTISTLAVTGATTLGALNAGAITGGAITGTSLNVGAGAVTAGAITAASVNTTGNVVAGNVFVGTAVEGNQVVTKGQSNAAIAAAFAPVAGQMTALTNTIEQNDKRASSGIASALAVANIPAVEAGKSGSFGIGLGNYNGRTSLAAGVTYRINQMQLKGSVAGGSGGKVGVGVGAGFSF